MSIHDDGGPAFPWQELNRDGSHYRSNMGMSLRDWFAGQALGVMLQAEGQRGGARTLARAAYIIADAMLEARQHQNIKDMEP